MVKVNVHHLLRNPIRRRIILLLSEGKRGATELMKETNLRPGKLYYHLSVLGPLVKQKRDRKYTLTKLGHKAHKYLRGEIPEIGVTPVGDINLRKPRNPLIYVTSRPLTSLMFDQPLVGLIVALVTLELQSLLMTVGPTLYVRPGLDIEKLVKLFSPEFGFPSVYALSLRHTVSILFIFIFCELIARYVFNKEGGTLSLFIGTIFSYIPMVLFSGLWFLTVGFIESMITARLMQFAFYAFEMWTFILLTYVLSEAKNIRVSYSAAIVFAMAYLTTVPLTELTALLW